MTFAEKLRELRDAKGFSETKLAELSGLTFGSIHNYGMGRRTPSYPAVLQLSRALGVDCTAFADCEDMKGEEEKPAAKKKPGKEKK
ncbi:MAG TPA: helix-turn-helix transcriptional regulator [Gemmata sp.]|jgi:transcriptional regulator with XRE-family HTH domain|nr:helix-turn-helix transcriptional regulator [Gemmata sp.]